jgi:hypothetical protein
MCRSVCCPDILGTDREPRGDARVRRLPVGSIQRGQRQQANFTRANLTRANFTRERSMRDPARCAEPVSKSAIKPYWLVIVIALLLEPSGVFAQAGNTGGTVGVQEKSTSGGQDQNVKPRPASRASRKPRAEGGATASADGTWLLSAVGRCIPPWQLTLLISNGVISGSGATGQVSRGGSASGHVVVLSLRFDFIGRFGARQGSGTFTGADGCPGTWTATKS